MSARCSTSSASSPASSRTSRAAAWAGSSPASTRPFGNCHLPPCTPISATWPLLYTTPPADTWCSVRSFATPLTPSGDCSPSGRSQGLGYQFAVRGKQIVDQRADLLQVQLGGRVRVQHGGVIDVLALAGDGGFNRQLLDVHVRAHERGQLGRNLAHAGWLDAVRVDEARHLDAAALRQLVDEAIVRNVAVDHARLARHDAVDDARSVLLAQPHIHRLVSSLQRPPHDSPAPHLSLAARQVLVEG